MIYQTQYLVNTFVIPKLLLLRVYVQIGMELIILVVLVAALEIYGDGNMREVFVLRN